MLEVIRKYAHSWLAKLILALITIPFAMWGVDSYMKYGGDEGVVARVGDQKIGRQEFDRMLREQEQRLRGMLGANFDPAMMERAEVRRPLLDNLINQRVLLQEAARTGWVPSDAELATVIASIPAFQQDGKFAKGRYEAAVREQGLTPQAFEARLRQEMMVGQLRDSIIDSALVSKTVLGRMIRISEQQREVSRADFTPEQFLAQAKVEPAALRSYYDKHQDEFRLPEQVRLEYVVLSVSELMKQLTVSDEEIKKYYAEHASRYGEPEQRRASHILITFPANATPAEKAAAHAKADEILVQLRRNPEKFAEIARQHSQDTGSAAQGGDLGFFGRGAMTKPFEEAVFGMKAGEIAGPVESQFGAHLIRLTAVRPARTTPLERVRDDIAQELKKQQAGRKFAEAAESFSNMVYEKPDSLKPAAQAFGREVQTSGWLARKGGENGLLGNEKLLQAAFAEDALKHKRNTEAVEVAPNTLISARVVDYRAASLRPFAEVSAELGQRLQREQAAALAVTQGKAVLAQLQEGKGAPQLPWSAPQTLSRQHAQGLSQAAVSRAFAVEPRTLPAYTWLENPQGGGTLLRISRVIEADAIDDAKKKAYAERMRQITAQENFAAYLQSLKDRSEITIVQQGVDKGGR